MTTPNDHTKPELRREISLSSAALMVVGGTIGASIFFVQSETARALPTGAWVLAVWVLGGVVAFAGALTYAELGAMMPDAGGPHAYIRAAFGELPAFLYGWMALASIASGALAAVALAFAGYLSRFVDVSPIGGPVGVAAVTLAAFTLLNVAGVRTGVAVQNVLTAAKVGAIVALIVGGLVLWSRIGAPEIVLDAPPARATLAVGLAAALIPVLFAIGGWQQMTMVAGEIRDPARTIPRALAIGVVIIMFCYIGVAAVYLRALGRNGLAVSHAVAADAATRFFGSAGALLISVAAMISILGFVQVALLANSRLVYATALGHDPLRGVAAIHPRFGTPHVAILLLGGWAITLLLVTRGNFGQLLSGVVFADWIFFGLGGAAVFALRHQRPDALRPYRVLGYPLIPAFFVVAAIAAILSSIVAQPLMSLFGAALVGIGIAIHSFLRSKERRETGR